MAQPSVFIIGAGLAGLACARVLKEAGLDVRLADKGRGPGGRASTRRSEIGRFDHGAAAITADDPDFHEAIDRWVTAGVAAAWQPRIAPTGGEPGAAPLWYLGIPAMNAIVRHEAEALGAEFGLEMGSPVPGTRARYALSTRCGHHVAEADLVVLAAPAPQTASLLPDETPLKAAAAGAVMVPCWTLMAGFEGGAPPFDVWELPDGQPLQSVHAQGARPRREPGVRFVAHASPAWSQARLEDDPEAVKEALLRELKSVTGVGAPLLHAAVHRWRYARVVKTAPGPFGMDRGRGLFTCGDWHLGPNMQHAWLSGNRLGQAILADL